MTGQDMPETRQNLLKPIIQSIQCRGGTGVELYLVREFTHYFAFISAHGFALATFTNTSVYQQCLIKKEFA